MYSNNDNFLNKIPIENVPPLTDELIQEIKDQPIPYARLVKNSNGATQLEINGQITPFLFGTIIQTRRRHAWIGRSTQADWHVDVWKQADFDCIQVAVNLSFAFPDSENEETLGCGPFWVGKEQYVNHEDFINALWRILRVHPDAKILLWIEIDAYPGWDKENPDELMRNEAGEGFILEEHYYLRVGNSPNYDKKERFAWSLFSEKFKSDVAKMLKQFIALIENSIPGKSVIGYMIGGGQDGQLYTWHAPNYARQKDANIWCDYSKPAIKAWRKWLKSKYKTCEALNTSWKTDLSDFELASPPKSANFIGEEVFHNPNTECQCSDWKQFIAEGRSDLIIDFARIIRSITSRQIIVGALSGESGCRSDLTANLKLLRAPEIDFLFHQATYSVRIPPAVGGINAVLDSHQANGKLFMCDNDQRTWVEKKDNYSISIGEIHLKDYDSFTGRAKSISELRAMWRRELGRLWSSGLGSHFMPIEAPYAYLDESIIDELGTIHSTAKTLQPPSQIEPASEVAVIFDERAIDYLKGGLTRLHEMWATLQRHEFNLSGVPFRTYYAGDLRDGKVPPAKLYIFLNLLNLDEKLISAINKLKSGGKTLVFMQSTGLVQGYDNSELISNVIGMQIATSKSKEAYHTLKVCNTHPILSECQTFVEGPNASDNEQMLEWNEQFSLYVTDSNADILANYTDTDKAAFAIKSNEDWNSVFIGTYLLNRHTIHALVKELGYWWITSPNVAVAASEGILMVHPLNSGLMTLRLNRKASLKEVKPGTISTEPSIQHELFLSAGDTYLFKVE